MAICLDRTQSLTIMNPWYSPRHRIPPAVLAFIGCTPHALHVVFCIVAVNMPPSATFDRSPLRAKLDMPSASSWCGRYFGHREAQPFSLARLTRTHASSIPFLSNPTAHPATSHPLPTRSPYSLSQQERSTAHSSPALLALYLPTTAPAPLPAH